jgi:hypothetical protein
MMPAGRWPGGRPVIQVVQAASAGQCEQIWMLARATLELAELSDDDAPAWLGWLALRLMSAADKAKGEL